MAIMKKIQPAIDRIYDREFTFDEVVNTTYMAVFVLFPSNIENTMHFGYWFAKCIPSYLQKEVRPNFLLKNGNYYVIFHGITAPQFKTLCASFDDSSIQLYKLVQEPKKS